METVIAIATLSALLTILVVGCEAAFLMLDDRRARPHVLVKS